ncbi:MAG: DinB family protein [Acidimicrobiales bacterium]
MVDHKPPRAVGERDVLHAAWQYQRESLVRKVEGVSEAEARRSPVASGTTLHWLLQHACFAERIWVRSRFAGEDLALAVDTVPSDTLAEAITTYRAEWRLIDAIVDAHDLDDAIDDPNGGDLPVTLRWIVVHLIEELARHAGHADILRELIDGDAGR